VTSANRGSCAANEMPGALDAREKSAMELAMSAIARNEPNRWRDQCLPVHGDGRARWAREERTAHPRSGDPHSLREPHAVRLVEPLTPEIGGFDLQRLKGSNQIKRRALLKLAVSAAALVLVGHRPAFADLEPDRMWATYRRYHLMIVGQRDDEKAIALASAVVAVLAGSLPTSRALLARAADTRRVGVLIATNQQDVAIMTAAAAEALVLGKPPFDDVRDARLSVIVSFGSHVLVCRRDFRARHAYLLAQTLAEHKDALPRSASAPRGSVPAHRGSHAFFAGERPPTD
jgi:hypothetical protein